MTDLKALMELHANLNKGGLKVTAELNEHGERFYDACCNAVPSLIQRLQAAEEERDNLAKFKAWVHDYLDRHGVPHHPPGTHGVEGCRIGDRMDWLMERLQAAEEERDRPIFSIDGMVGRLKVMSQFERQQIVRQFCPYCGGIDPANCQC